MPENKTTEVAPAPDAAPKMAEYKCPDGGISPHTLGVGLLARGYEVDGMQMVDGEIVVPRVPYVDKRGHQPRDAKGNRIMCTRKLARLVTNAPASVCDQIVQQYGARGKAAKKR